MAAGDAYVVYPLDTVHQEMDSVNCSHSVYKSVWSPVISRIVLEKSLPANLYDEFTVAVIKDSQIVDQTLLAYLFTHHMVICYMMAMSFTIQQLSYYCEKKESKGLEVPCKYN